jgi:hypothetical protein
MLSEIKETKITSISFFFLGRAAHVLRIVIIRSAEPCCVVGGPSDCVKIHANFNLKVAPYISTAVSALQTLLRRVLLSFHLSGLLCVASVPTRQHGFGGWHLSTPPACHFSILHFLVGMFFLLTFI